MLFQVLARFSFFLGFSGFVVPSRPWVLLFLQVLGVSCSVFLFPLAWSLAQVEGFGFVFRNLARIASGV